MSRCYSRRWMNGNCKLQAKGHVITLLVNRFCGTSTRHIQWEGFVEYSCFWSMNIRSHSTHSTDFCGCCFSRTFAKKKKTTKMKQHLNPQILITSGVTAGGHDHDQPKIGSQGSRISGFYGTFRCFFLLTWTWPRQQKERLYILSLFWRILGIVVLVFAFCGRSYYPSLQASWQKKPTGNQQWGIYLCSPRNFT